MTKSMSHKLFSLLLALLMTVTMLPATVLAAEEHTETDTSSHEAHEGCSHEALETCYHAAHEDCSHDHDEIEPEEEADETLIEEPALEHNENTEPIGEENSEISGPEITENVQESDPSIDDVPVIPESSLSWTLEADGMLYISGSGYIEAFSSAEEQPWRDVREQIYTVRFDTNTMLDICNINDWFMGCVNIQEITVPVSVRMICPHDFADCVSLNSLTYGGVDVLAEIKMDYSQQSGDETLMTASHSAGGIMPMSTAHCGVLNCTCTGYCTYTYGNYRVAPESNNYHIMTVYCAGCGRTDGIIVTGSHSFSGNSCTLCGYTKACSHSSTYTTWVTSCYWERHCSSCGAFMSSGTIHGPYSYGSWTYYSSSQHRRAYTCVYGDSGTYYEYGSHSTTTNFSQYNSTQHCVSSYCSTCATIVSTSYEGHFFTYGSWSNYSETQHRRLKTCSYCDYNEYEYANHALTYGIWSVYSDTQHQRTVSCSSCSYSAYDYGAHTDSNNDGLCDSCGYSMSVFSVTVPASLTLTVSARGEVYGANNAAIINNSTGPVAVTGVILNAANGWRLVPYSTNMAAAKVDAKLIGLSLNEAQSSITGSSESLTLPDAWAITTGSSLPLSYDAVVSATSRPISEQALTVIFVLEWASK